MSLICHFFTLVCDFFSQFCHFLLLFFFHLSLNFSVFFTPCKYFFSSKFTFFDKVLFYVSGLVKYNPMRASSYSSLPKELKSKQGCLNIENDDEKCFLWSILASLHSVQHRNSPDRVSKYQQYEHDLNMSGIQYPVDYKRYWKI